jgi:hypothetical protein
LSLGRRREDHLVFEESPEARREAELSNVPVLVAQLARFEQRRAYWDARLQELCLSMRFPEAV